MLKRLLSLDGGGIHGLSELALLREFMQRVNFDRPGHIPKPCEYFDLIGGTGTGGLIAIMLGRLGMSVDEAMEAYIDLGKNAFAVQGWWGPKMFKMFNTFDSGKGKAFEQEIRNLVEKYTGKPDALMMDAIDPTQNSCPIFVCAMAQYNLQEPRLFRTYEVAKNADYNLPIWEAARVTNASATFLDSYTLGTGSIKESFVDAGLGCNNPVQKVFEEAEDLFNKGGQKEPFVMVSLGAGHPGVMDLPDALLPDDPAVRDALKKIAIDCERAAEKFDRHAARFVETYYRFNVEQGMQKIPMDEWNKLSDVITHTKAYLGKHEVSMKVDKLVETLYQESTQAEANTTHPNAKQVLMETQQQGD